MAHARKRTWTSPASGSRKANGRKAGESWEARYKVEGKWRKKAGFKTRAEAEAYALEQESQALAGVARPNGDKITLTEFADGEFFPHIESRRERDVIAWGHACNMKGHYRNYIGRTRDWSPHAQGARVRNFDGGIGHMKLSQLRPRHVEKFRDCLLATGLHTGTVRAVLTTLHSILDLARRRDYVAINAAEKIPIETPRNARGDRRTPPPKAAVAACLSAAPDGLKLIVMMAACTGLRSGELRALHHRHVDLEDKFLTVECAADFKNRLGPPKSKAGYRSIPLSDALCESIDAYRQSLGSWGADDLMFPGKWGGVISSGTWRTRLNVIFDRLAWPPRGDPAAATQTRFNMHELRHFAISTWIAANMGLKAVQTFAGHADAGITWNRYGHLFPDDRHHDKINEAALAVFS